jgi:hypothetical protein
MLRIGLGIVAIAMALALAPVAFAAPAEQKAAPSEKRIVPKKRHVTRHWRGYGYLPGVRTPEEIEDARAEHYYRLYGPRYYGPAWPGFYRGRWNGGGFGPCWTQTPIGPMWNCGR